MEFFPLHPKDGCCQMMIGYIDLLYNIQLLLPPKDTSSREEEDDLGDLGGM